MIHEFHIAQGIRVQQSYPPVLYYPSGLLDWFVAKEEYEAEEVWPEYAPRNVLFGDKIRVFYSFTYDGPGGSVILEVGSCKSLGASVYDRGTTETKEIDLSSTQKSYSGYVEFSFKSLLFFGFSCLFVLLQGQEYEVVYKNAFEQLGGAELSNLNMVEFSAQ